MVGCRLLDYLEVRKDTYLFYTRRSLNHRLQSYVVTRHLPSVEFG
jgi:hypothetical protein